MTPEVPEPGALTVGLPRMHKEPGEVRDFLVIHNAKAIQSPAGGKIHTRTVGGRKTYFTEEQELFE